ncbi:uncharacterized protein AB675_166 [Cyphellophora attinorum]|uniref:BTB domain-containing protein n=1 Tax=Cyphellophora attinorum TaxID=1664694 RepID=A0A0N1H7V8_9EURO|nr:uncharacterized protein AB675_166 [Phialophora attinorum]KPI37804.1 hypothetical protein AB675_166 [Phialophora attinorum]
MAQKLDGPVEIPPVAMPQAQATQDDHATAEKDKGFVTVIDSQNVSHRILKSTLVKDSGFFRRMFQHDFQESQLAEVRLHDDGKEFGGMLDLLSFFGGRSVYEVVWAQHRSLEERRYKCYHESGDYLDRVLELYLAADKYDMQSLRQLCTEKLFIMAFGMVGVSTWSSVPRQTKHLNTICDHSGEYPRDLWDAYCFGVMFCFEKRGNADGLVDALEGNPKLSVYLNKKLVEALSGAGSLRDKLIKEMKDRDIPFRDRCCA